MAAIFSAPLLPKTPHSQLPKTRHCYLPDYHLQNDRLSHETYNYWLVKALYPEVSQTIEKKLADDPKELNQQAEKEMEKQDAITAAKAQAEQADKEQRAARDNLEKMKAEKRLT